jgi:zinc transporter ZupT
MNTYIALALVAFVPPLIIIFLPKDRKFFDNTMVRGFGLGVYTALILILLREGVEHGGITTAGIWFGIGLVISFIIGLLVKEFHHHHEHDIHNHHDHSHNKASMFRLLVSDFFHNIVDGIAIVASFAVNPSVGITSLFGILGHQIVQQGGQQILLVESGITPKKALIMSFCISLSVFLGLIMSDSLEVILICVSAGIVLWKVVADIRHTKWSTKTIVGFILGAVLLAGLLLAIPHEH